MISCSGCSGERFFGPRYHDIIDLLPDPPRKPRSWVSLVFLRSRNSQHCKDSFLSLQTHDIMLSLGNQDGILVFILVSWLFRRNPCTTLTKKTKIADTKTCFQKAAGFVNSNTNLYNSDPFLKNQETKINQKNQD